MRLFRHPTAGVPRGSVIAIGNFDGLHVGHRAVIEAARGIAQEKGVPLALLTFEPHPRSVFAPGGKPFRLTPFHAKTRLLTEAGIDLLFTLRFDRAFAAQSAEDFARRLLAERLGVGHVVIGSDFTFGHKRTGNATLLADMAGALGFAVTVLEPVADASGKICSASRIRAHIEEGRIKEASLLLGRSWEIEGHVRSGDRRGRTLGFPTANLAMANYLHPAAGVYAVRAGIVENGRVAWHDGVANFGRRPTFDGADWRLETHLLDFSGDLYGRSLRIAFVDFIRPDAKFADADALVAAMRDDARKARDILARGERR